MLVPADIRAKVVSFELASVAVLARKYGIFARTVQSKMRELACLCHSGVGVLVFSSSISHWRRNLHELKKGPAIIVAPIPTKSSKIWSHLVSGSGGTGANLSAKVWSELSIAEAAA